MKDLIPATLEVLSRGAIVKTHRTKRRLRGDQLSGSAAIIADHLRSRVIGQDEAVTAVSEVLQQYSTGLRPSGMAAGAFLLTGPTGVGKTLLPKELAKLLNGGAKQGVHLLIVDCASMQRETNSSTLLGAGAGYVGHDTTAALLTKSTFSKLTAHSGIGILVFDEIDKASNDIWITLLSALSEGRLMNGKGENLDFEPMLVFLTSNLGSSDMQKLAQGKMGLYRPDAKALDQEIMHAGQAALRKKFTPEFLNRIDREITFHSLSEANMARILDVELASLQDLITFSSVRQAKLVVSVCAGAKRRILEEAAKNPSLGARHLIRVLTNRLSIPLANLLTGKSFTTGDLITADCDEEGIYFQKELSDLSREEMNAAIELCYQRHIERPTLTQLRRNTEIKLAA